MEAALLDAADAATTPSINDPSPTPFDGLRPVVDDPTPPVVETPPVVDDDDADHPILLARDGITRDGITMCDGIVRSMSGRHFTNIRSPKCFNWSIGWVNHLY